MSVHPFQCPYCPRSFPFPPRVRQHIKDKHPGKPFAKFPKQHAADDEPSIASRMIDAQLDRAMGLPVDDDLLDMLPDEFPYHQ